MCRCEFVWGNRRLETTECHQGVSRRHQKIQKVAFLVLSRTCSSLHSVARAIEVLAETLYQPVAFRTDARRVSSFRTDDVSWVWAEYVAYRPRGQPLIICHGLVVRGCVCGSETVVCVVCSGRVLRPWIRRLATDGEALLVTPLSGCIVCVSCGVVLSALVQKCWAGCGRMS